jgi:hypothetical protein
LLSLIYYIILLIIEKIKKGQKMEPLYKVSKHNSFGVSIIPDEKDKSKSYIMVDGYVIGVQVNTGTIYKK